MTTETTLTSPIVLTTDYAKAHMGRAVPGAYFDRLPDGTKGWMLDDPTPRAAAVALRLFPELAFTRPELAAARDLLLQDVRPFDNATPAGIHVAAGAVRAQLEAEKKDLYNFQALDTGYVAAVLARHGGAYIGWERGLGKTLGACALIDELGAQRTLIVCPNTAKQSVWAAELKRWCPWLDVTVLPNDKSRRDRVLHYWKADPTWDRDPQALIVHYEALVLIAGKKKKGKGTEIGRGWDKLGKWDLVIADEAHRVANPKALMSRALKRIPTTYKLALSGSIIQNHAEELFSPLQWLFPERYKAKWRDWNDRYLDYVEGYGKICVGVKLERLEEMRDELGVFMVYRRKSDELDLPPKTEQTLMVELTATQRTAYNELLQTCVTQLEDGTKIKAAEGLVMMLRLRQLATGLDLLGHTVDDSAKLDLAVEMIEDNPDEAFVVFSWFKACCHTLAERLRAKRIGCFVVDGDVKAHDRADYIERFQAGEGRVFIGTLATLSESVTLHRATNAVFLDRHWNPATNVQAEDRIYRIGQDKPVTITHLVAKDTVDELRVLPAIANKEALRRLILGGT